MFVHVSSVMLPFIFAAVFWSVAAVAHSADVQQLLRRLDAQDERLGRIERQYETLKVKAHKRINILKDAENEARHLLNVHVTDTMTGMYLV